MTKEEIRHNIEEALSLRAQGYNCSQCVLMTCGKITGLSREDLAKIGIALGGGFGGCGGQCGVLTAHGILLGYEGFGAPADKGEIYSKVRQIKESFEDRYGTSVCKELKAKRIPCPTLIAEGIETILKDK